MTEETKRTIQQQIMELINEAVKNERDRCASIAVQYGHSLIAERIKHVDR